MKGTEGNIEVDLADGSYVDVLTDTKVNVVNKQCQAPKDVVVLEYKEKIKIKKLYCEAIDYKGYQTF